MFRLTTTLKSGRVVVSEHDKIRDVGKRVAYCLADNGAASRKEATQLAMLCEKNHQLSYGEFTFVVEKV